jgi:hypothetical protein
MAEAIIYMVVRLVTVSLGEPGAGYHSCVMNPRRLYPTAPVAKGKSQSARRVGVWGKVLTEFCLRHCDFQSPLERNIEPEDTDGEHIILRVRVILSGVFGFHRMIHILRTMNNQRDRQYE